LDIPELTTLSLIYEAVTDAPALARENQEKVDALFFLGLAPYLFALHSVPRAVPWFNIGLPSGGVWTALIQARRHLNGPARFSVDVIGQEDLYAVLDETDIEVQAVYNVPYRASPEHENELVSFHSECYEEGKVEFCLTWLLSAWKRLVAKGIPAYYVSPPVQAIRDALTQAAATLRSGKEERLKTVVGLYNIENASALSEERLGEVRDFFAFHALKHGVLFVGKSPSLFQIVESHAQFMAATGEFSRSPLKERLLKTFPELELRMGYGLAPTISTAEEWARRALDSARAGDVFDGCMFDGRDYRRMGEPEPSSSSPLRSTETFSEIARKIDVTDATFLRYLRILEVLESPFSAREFAHMAGIQPQASRKIFNLLAREEVLQNDGKRPASSKGRPEVLYRLTLNRREGM
jgi:hypothetical protein